MPDTPASAPGDLVELGRIVSAYGVRGWVKVQPHSSQAEVLLQAAQWWLKAPVSPLGEAGAFSRPLAAAVLAARPQGASVVAQLDLAPDRDAAEALKGHTVWAPRFAFPPAQDDEYYWVDLIGCRLYGLADNGDKALIGEVVEVSDNGAHAVLHVARAREDAQGGLVLLRNQKGRTIDVLVPFVQAHVPVVDIAGKRLESDWPVEF